MSNILLVYSLMEPPVHFSRDQLEQFCQVYGSQLRMVEAGKMAHDDLTWSDVLFFVRSQTALEAGIAALARKSGRIVVTMYDDNFFALPEHHVRRPLEERAQLKQIRNSHIIVSPNDVLGAKMAALGTARFIRTDTMVRPEKIKPPKVRQTNELSVLYYSNDGSSGMFEKVIGPSLPMLADMFGKRLSWTFIATHPDMGEAGEKMQVNYLPHLEFTEFQKLLAETPFDLGVAPLEADVFSECKYINKFLEYTSAGFPCIYSDVSPYNSVVRDGENGILCENTQQGWLNAFQRMAESLEFRRNIVESAQHDLQTKFSPEFLLERLHKDIPEFTDHKAQQNPGTLFWVRCASLAERIANPFAHALGRLRLEGMGSVISWTISHYILRR